jgi:ribosomal protein S12 methylthiotransferase accessory factor
MPSGKAPDREPPALRDAPFSTPIETIRKAHRIVSPRVGILRRVASVVHHAGDPLCYAFGVVPGDTRQFSTKTVSSKSGGAGLDPESALAAALGEAIERYCMLFYDKRDMVHARARDLGDAAVDPALLSLYSREQIGRRRRTTYFDDDSLIRWVWGYSLTQRRWRLVPAAQVYLGYRFDDDEAYIADNASTGLAAGNTLVEAILSGLYEVIERDAFTTAWLFRHIRRRIEVDDEDLAAVMAERYHASHPRVEISLFDITSDIPVFCAFAIMRRPSESGPVHLVGAAARLTAGDALKKALLEAGQEISYVRFLMHDMPDWQPDPDYANVKTFDEHFMVYNKRPELIDEAFEFCHGTTAVARASQLPADATGRPRGDCERLVERLGARGHEVIVVDITTPDIADLDLHVVRVMVPGLVPLHGDHNWPFLGVPRLHERAGAVLARRGDRAFNPFPHPFP